MEDIEQRATQILLHLPPELLLSNNERDKITQETWTCAGHLHILFMLLAAEAISGVNDKTRILPLITALHSSFIASILFDDVVDQDKQESITERYGTSTSVNLALLLLTFAYEKTIQFCRDTSLGSEKSFVLLQHLHENFFLSATGQIRDFVEDKNFVTEEHYLNRIELKSGKPIAGVFSVIAIAQGADPITIQKWSKFGYLHGVFAQLINDLKSCRTNNLRRNSIAKQTMTLPVINALSTLKEPLLTQFQQLWFKEDKSQADIDHVLELLQKAGSIVYVNLKLAQLFSEMQSLLLDSSVDNIITPEETRLLETIKSVYFAPISLDMQSP